MNTVALILVLLGVMAMALHGITQKIILNNNTLSKKEILVFQHLLAVPVLLITLPIFYFGFGESLSPISLKIFTIAIAGTIVANIFIQYANVRARELSDLSLTAPISAMTPGLVAVAAIILGEWPSTQGAIGIVLIMLGTYVHSLENASSWKDFVKPFGMLFLPSNFNELDKNTQDYLIINRTALRWAYGSALIGTIGLIFDGLTARSGSVSIGFAIQCLMLSFVFMAFPKDSASEVSNKITSTIKISSKRSAMILLGIFYGLHAVFISSAFRFAPVAYIGSLKRLSIIATIVLSILILKETKANKRFWPAVVITAGAIMLALDGVLGRVVDIIHTSIS